MATSSSTNNYLPEDLVVEILSWLMPKSLVRFKSVCKHRYSLITSLIDDPEFVAKHLYNAGTNIFYRTTLLIHNNLRADESCVIPSVTYLTRFGDHNYNKRYVTFDLDLELLFGKVDNTHFSDDLNAFHCNGIICLENYNSIALFNPSLADEFKTFVPEPKLDIESDYCQIEGMGFGCDLTGENYKLVRILSYHYEDDDDDDDDNGDDLRAEVYTFGIDQSWREIRFPIRAAWFAYMHSHVYFEGACYWLITLGHSRLVLSFHIGSEVFHVIFLPVEIQILGFYSLSSLAVWGYSLYFFMFPSGEGTPKSIQMWVMDVNYEGDDGGCSYSWRKYSRIGSFEGIDSSLTFLTSGELLMNDEDRLMVSYNLCTQSLSNLYEHGAPHFLYIGPYVKSLVSVKGI